MKSKTNLTHRLVHDWNFREKLFFSEAVMLQSQQGSGHAQKVNYLVFSVFLFFVASHMEDLGVIEKQTKKTCLTIKTIRHEYRTSTVDELNRIPNSFMSGFDYTILHLRTATERKFL